MTNDTAHETETAQDRPMAESLGDGPNHTTHFGSSTGKLSITAAPGATIDDLRNAYQEAALHIQRSTVTYLGSGETGQTPIDAVKLSPHFYAITGFNLNHQDAVVKERMNELQRNPLPEMSGPGTYLPLIFQNGDPSKVGYNGVTFEAVLTILVDRLTSMNQGTGECDENYRAIDAMRQSLDQLHQRRARLDDEARAKVTDQSSAPSRDVSFEGANFDPAGPATGADQQ